MDPHDAGASARVTLLLRKWQEGDRDALDRLIPLVHDELKVIASRYMAHEWRKGTLQTTGLVNEAYMKLVDQQDVDWQNRAHFFAIAAQVMRRILIDDARRRLRTKRGGNAVQVPVEGIAVAAPEPDTDPVDVIGVDRALQSLEQVDQDQAKLVELRFRWPDRGGSGGSARCVADDREARMGRREGLVVSRADHGQHLSAVSV
jgi:RNA polymerase sigma-70 factor (ECF subfamily)